MKILAFDTTSLGLTVALLENNILLEKISLNESGKQAEMLIPLLEKILNNAALRYENLDLIATAKGPASFTGVRVGLACAKTLQLATKLPLLCFDSLAVIAYKHRTENGRIFVATDAQMGEFFIGEFFAKNGKVVQVAESRLARLEELSEIFFTDNFFLCGNAKKTIAQILHDKNLSYKISKNSLEEDVSSADLIGLMAYEKFIADGRLYDSSENSNPVYLRAPKISVRKK